MEVELSKSLAESELSTCRWEVVGAVGVSLLFRYHALPPPVDYLVAQALESSQQFLFPTSRTIVPSNLVDYLVAQAIQGSRPLNERFPRRP
jgi:hypothetical protein